MKLWVQACGALGSDPAWDAYEERLIKHLRKVARTGTEIDLHGTKVFGPGVVANKYDAYLHSSQIIEAAIEAERKGYDAFVQMGMLDLGYYEIKEAVSLPVIFPIEISLHIAALLAPKVGFLAMNQAYLGRLNEWARGYGFGDRLTPGGWVSLAPKDLQDAFRNPGNTVDILAEEARHIGKRGANIVICAGNPITLLFIEHGMTDIDGVRIMDSIGVPIKAAEMMVELHQMGITRDKMGGFGPLPKSAVSAVRRLYGLE